MKTATLKTATLIIIICTGLFATAFITKNIVHSIKYLYGLEVKGKGTACFFNLIQ